MRDAGGHREPPPNRAGPRKAPAERRGGAAAAEGPSCCYGAPLRPRAPRAVAPRERITVWGGRGESERREGGTVAEKMPRGDFTSSHAMKEVNGCGVLAPAKQTPPSRSSNWCWNH